MAPGDSIRKTYAAIGGQELLRIEIDLDGRMPPELTPAEAEVASMLLLGMSDREIAQRRRTTVRTVANQLQAIYTKLGMNSRAELVAHLAHRVIGR
ncbi:MAG: helix-turn-helix transcriptional regulator [Deltaproteobacteria bacterium]|nr:helix-turn-helix transcriptional regulator [Kofleriaceae bacterium]